MANIKYCRCDDRLIHGQVIHLWVNELQVKKLVIIDDNAIFDPVEQCFIKMAAPKDVETELMSISMVKSKYIDSKEEDTTLFLIRNLDTLKKMYELNLTISNLIIGRIPTDIHRKRINANVFMNEEEHKFLNEIVSEGVHLTIQAIPDDLSLDMEEINERWIKE